MARSMELFIHATYCWRPQPASQGFRPAYIMTRVSQSTLLVATKGLALVMLAERPFATVLITISVARRRRGSMGKYQYQRKIMVLQPLEGETRAGW